MQLSDLQAQLLQRGQMITEQLAPLAAPALRDSDALLLKATDGREHRIRLNGIDAPELQQPFGKESQELLQQLLELLQGGHQ